MIPGSEDPPPDLDTNELFGAGFEGLLESINEIGNEAGKLVDAAPLDIFNLDNMAEDEEKKRIAEENAQEDDGKGKKKRKKKKKKKKQDEGAKGPSKQEMEIAKIEKLLSSTDAEPRD